MTLLTVFVGIIAFSNLVLLLAIAYLAVAVKKLLDTSIKPTITSVNDLVGKVEDRAERIMDIGEDTARKVSGTVVATTDMVQNSITSPVISLSSMVAGISKAVATWRRVSAKT